MINIAETQYMFDSLTDRSTDQISHKIVAYGQKNLHTKKIAVNISLKNHVIS